MSVDAVVSPAPAISRRLAELKMQRAESVQEEAALVTEARAIERLLPRLLAQRAAIDAKVVSLTQEKAIFDQAVTEMEEHYKNILEVHEAHARSRAAGPGPAYRSLAAQVTGTVPPSHGEEREGPGDESLPCSPSGDPLHGGAFPPKPTRRVVPPPPPSQE